MVIVAMKKVHRLYDKYVLGAQIEKIIFRKSFPSDNNSSEIHPHGNMFIQVILSADDKFKYFIGLHYRQI